MQVQLKKKKKHLSTDDTVRDSAGPSFFLEDSGAYSGRPPTSHIIGREDRRSNINVPDKKKKKKKINGVVGYQVPVKAQLRTDGGLLRLVRHRSIDFLSRALDFS